MNSMLLLLSSLALLGAAVIGRWRRRAARSVPTRSVSLPVSDAPDALPTTEPGESGLSAFYAYQLAASRIERA